MPSPTASRHRAKASSWCSMTHPGSFPVRWHRPRRKSIVSSGLQLLYSSSGSRAPSRSTQWATESTKKSRSMSRTRCISDNATAYFAVPTPPRRRSSPVGPAARETGPAGGSPLDGPGPSFAMSAQPVAGLRPQAGAPPATIARVPRSWPAWGSGVGCPTHPAISHFRQVSSGVDCSSEASEAIPVERVPHPLPPSVTLHKARLAQDLEVVGDSRLALAERTDEVADTDLALR